MGTFPGHPGGLGIRHFFKLTKTNKYFLFVFVFLQLVLLIDGTVVSFLGVLDNLRCCEVNTIVKVTKEEQVVKVGGEVELAQTLVFQCSHAF